MPDKEKEWSLIIEQANIQMKLALKTGVVDSVQKEVIKSNVRKIIDETKNALKGKEAPKELIEKVENTLKLRFVDWYKFVTAEILKGAQTTKNPLLFKKYQDITGEELKNSKGMNLNIDGYDRGSIKNIEDYMTTGKTAGAQNFIDDYVSKVKKTMKDLADKNLVMKDRLGRKMSLRNLAEMTARYDHQQERLQKLKEEGIEYVVASSHSNASKRCQIWQGKIFIIDCEIGATFKQTVDLSYRPKPLGKIDGIDYYSLKDAMLHGFLGYNCRHRLVKYMKGMDLFNEYDANTIAKERGLEERQRYLERKIRKAKEKATLAVTKEERKIYTQESKHYQEVYAKFCQDKGLVRYDWRTRITREERENKYIVQDGKYLEAQEASYQIKRNGYVRDIELEKKIEDYVGTNPVPKVFVEKFGDEFDINLNAKIYFRLATSGREGSAEHIVKNHNRQADDVYLWNLKDTILNSDEFKYEGLNEWGQNRFVFDKFLYSKGSKERRMHIVIDQIDSLKFEIVSGYVRKK